MAIPVISYVDAKAKGLKRYFTGKPCKNGHLSERFVSNCGCAECAYARTNAWGKQNTELKYELYSRWIKQHPGYNAKWVKDNPDSALASARKWYRANADSQIKNAIEWRKQNPEKARAIVRNRHARRKRAGGSHTAEQILEMLARQNWKCAGCGVSIKKRRHIDHKIPLVLGGSNDISNLQGLCPSCNCSKGPKDPVKWAQENGKLL